MGALVAALAIAVAACGGAASPTPAANQSTEPSVVPSAAPAASATPAASLDTTPVMITVWDYYGKGTSPFAPEVLAAFQKEYPWITVNHEDVDWDSYLTKFNTAVSSGTGPDVATIDGTWYSTLASNGYLASLDEVSGGMLNGTPIADQYTPAAVDAMTFDGNLITMMFDFDVYALYYRADLFEKKGIAVPTNWDELLAASKAIAEDRNGDGKPDHFLYAVRPDDFKFSQFLFQGGGSLLTPDNTQAAFNSQAGVDALDVQKAFLDQGTGLYWSDAEADITPAIADERVAMFNDGLFYMGLMKSAAPKQSGKWKVAIAPYSNQPGSYLGGTGLSIPVTSQKQQAAWLLIQYMLRPEVQVNALYGIAGAPPATTAALASPDLNKPDEYFGGQSPFPVFLEAMNTATAFPKVGAWNDISTILSKACVAALLGKMTPQAALDDAAAKVNKVLSK
jgi:ABC-type glycerol-3-phosphate transport system substrate-binding protein